MHGAVHDAMALRTLGGEATQNFRVGKMNGPDVWPGPKEAPFFGRNFAKVCSVFCLGAKHQILGGGFKHVLFLPRSLEK